MKQLHDGLPGSGQCLALAPSLYFRKGGARKWETNLGFIRLLELGEIDVALGRQIRFNVWAQSEGEKNEKRICSFGSGMSDSGSHGGGWLGGGGESCATQSGGENRVGGGLPAEQHPGMIRARRLR